MASSASQAAVASRGVTPLQTVLAGIAVAIDAAYALALAAALWPWGAVMGVFPLMAVGVFAARRRGRFRALVAVVAAVQFAVGAALLMIGGLALAASGLMLIAAAIAPSPESRHGRPSKARGHAGMIVVAALVLLALAPWAAGLWPG